MKILTGTSNNIKINNEVKVLPQKAESEKTPEIQDKVDIQSGPVLAEKCLSFPKKVLQYTQPRFFYHVKPGNVKSLQGKLSQEKLSILAELTKYKFPEAGFKDVLTKVGFTEEESVLVLNNTYKGELGDKENPDATSAAMAGGIQGYIFAGGPVGLVSGALGGYVGTKIGEATKSEMGALAGGAAVGAVTGVATTVALAALLAGAIPNPITLTGVAVLGGLAGSGGALSGNKFTSVADGVSGGITTGLIAQALTGNSAMTIAGAVGGGVGGIAPTKAGKVILGGAAGAVTGAVSTIPALMTWGTAALPILAISAGAGAISGASGAVIGPVIRRTIRNVTMDVAQKADTKVDKMLENRTVSSPVKIAAGAGMGVIMLAPLGGIFGGSAGVAVGAGAGALIFGGKTLYDEIKKKKALEKKAEEKSALQA
ncbi:MAG TPA: hypothetical protein PL110_06695 [Candidatus Eremiobacteraeota bacterium]|nr:hypothetical protein [Candidatus Eremiobacteraeota bacterium]